MAMDPTQAARALSRFGLGARPGDLGRAKSDPRGFLAQEVRRREVPQPAGPDLVGTTAALTLLREENQRIEAARAARPAATMEMGGPMAGGAPDASRAASGPPQPPPVPQRLYRAETLARLDAALATDGGFVERLVWFWSNHFAVSVAKGQQTRATAGAFEREAIRPHVLGRFANMLLAVEQHPTMLFYLDNQLSLGPNSPAGKNRNRGLNENLAREILELHTLGVGGGYAQEDVTSLARILTGWTIVGPEGRIGRPNTFAFNVNWHEPGDHVLLGKWYPDHGPDQGRDALLDLARHPSTAGFIARKLARHFVADVPPPGLVDRLAGVFRDSEGDLAAVSLALLEAPESWGPDAQKVRSPQEFLTASLRLLGMVPDGANQVIGALNALGQPLWSPPGPNGYPDGVDHWASAEGMKTRLDVAARLGQRASGADPGQLVEEALGPLASAETRQAVARAESRAQAVALLLMSPEFQRR